MTKFGSTYNQGDICLVPFPFTDLTQIKKRPVLILSKEQSGEDSIVCGITSNLKVKENSIYIQKSDLTTGTLPKPCLIQVDKLFTLDKSLMIKKNRDT